MLVFSEIFAYVLNEWLLYTYYVLSPWDLIFEHLELLALILRMLLEK